MSKTYIIVIIIVVIVVVAGGAWWYISSSQKPVSVAPTQQNVATNSSQNGTQATGSVSSANPQDTSDASINSDLSAIDTQMTGLNTDSNNVNQSLNNQ